MTNLKQQVYHKVSATKTCLGYRCFEVLLMETIVNLPEATSYGLKDTTMNLQGARDSCVICHISTAR